MEELKPCPFCGGKAELYEREEETKDKDLRWYILCEQCTAMIYGPLKKKVIEAWNKRVSNG